MEDTTTYDRRKDLLNVGDEPSTVLKTGTEVKYQFIDRMLTYGTKSLGINNVGDAYNRLLFDSILAINPVSDGTYSYVSGLINSALVRLAEGDYYNARLLMERAIETMTAEAKYYDAI